MRTPSRDSRHHQCNHRVVTVALQAAIFYSSYGVNGLHGLSSANGDVDRFKCWHGFGTKPMFSPVEKHRAMYIGGVSGPVDL